MVTYGLIASKTYNKKLKVEEVFQQILRNHPDKDFKVTSGGNKEGAERHIRSLCLDLELEYQEYNPAYTSWNSYSAEAVPYYGKQYHISQIIHRYRQLIIKADYVILFVDGKTFQKSPIRQVYNFLTKNKIKHIVVE